MQELPVPAAAGAAVGAGADDARLGAERARLVRFCAKLTGDADAAEDLAQETLLLAHRFADRIYAPDVRWPWLAGVARNVCRHWRGDRGRERLRVAARPSPPPAAEETAGTPDALASDGDLEVELERSELAALLDRAMALLPPETRHVLIERYVEESPQAEIALRLGFSEGAVAMRLHRGKLALRRVLLTAFREEAAAYGLLDEGTAAWQETRIWCPWCGRRRLLGRFGAHWNDGGDGGHRGDGIGTERASLALRCAACCAAPGARVADAGTPTVFGGVKGYRAAYSRLLEWTHASVAPALERGVLPCPGCRLLVRIEVHHSPDGVSAWAVPRLRARCGRCGRGYDGTLGGLVLAHPQVRRFWRAHPRLRLLPVREIETGGIPALVVSFEDVAGRARLDALCARDSLAVLAVVPSAGCDGAAPEPSLTCPAVAPAEAAGPAAPSVGVETDPKSTDLWAPTRMPSNT